VTLRSTKCYKLLQLEALVAAAPAAGHRGELGPRARAQARLEARWPAPANEAGAEWCAAAVTNVAGLAAGLFPSDARLPAAHVGFLGGADAATRALYTCGGMAGDDPDGGTPPPAPRPEIAAFTGLGRRLGGGRAAGAARAHRRCRRGARARRGHGAPARRRRRAGAGKARVRRR
jgi:hypothetical protein